MDDIKTKLGMGPLSSSHERTAWRAMLHALPKRLRHFEETAPGSDGVVDGATICKLLEELLNACGGNEFEWISMQSPRPNAPWGTLCGISPDWRTKYRWLEASVVQGSSEGWMVHLRGIQRERRDDGGDVSELLLTAKCFDRHYAWRAAQLLSEFFDA